MQKGRFWPNQAQSWPPSHDMGGSLWAYRSFGPTTLVSPQCCSASALNEIEALVQSVPLTFIPGSEHLGTFGIYALLKEFYLLYTPGSQMPLLSSLSWFLCSSCVPHDFPGPGLRLTIFRRLYYCCFCLLDKACKLSLQGLWGMCLWALAPLWTFPLHCSKRMFPGEASAPWISVVYFSREYVINSLI